MEQTSKSCCHSTFNQRIQEPIRLAAEWGTIKLKLLCPTSTSTSTSTSREQLRNCAAFIWVRNRSGECFVNVPLTIWRRTCRPMSWPVRIGFAWLHDMVPPKKVSTSINTAIIHCVSKNIPDVFSYDSRKHWRIFIIFGRNIVKKQAIKRCYTFPSHLINASALPCKSENTENGCFHVNVSCWFANRHTSHMGIITKSLLDYYSFMKQ